MRIKPDFVFSFANKSKKVIMKKNIILLVLYIVTGSCDKPPCENTNPVFAKYAPDSKEYKDELAKQLNRVDKSSLTYWMESFATNGESPRMMAHIQGDGLCAKIVLLLKDSKDGVENIVERQGMGYRGAELKDLEYDVIQSNTGTEFVFKKVGSIVD